MAILMSKPISKVAMWFFKSAAKPSNEIGALIEGKFGFKPSVFILSDHELKEGRNQQPIPNRYWKNPALFLL